MQKIKALIVDDEPLVGLFIKRVLLKRGVEVLEIAYNEETALAAIYNEKPDVVFMDINIKGALDGISVIRKASIPKHTHVFYISAYNSHEIIEDAMTTKPSNYLIKPISEEDMIIALGIVKNHRHYEKDAVPQSETIMLDHGIWYKHETNKLFIDNEDIALTHIEHKILHLLIENINQKVSHETIKEIVWEGKEIANTTLRDAISAIRRKASKICIDNCYGEGYKLIKKI